QAPRADPPLRRGSAAALPMIDVRIDEERLVELALRAVSIPSFTGDELPLAEFFRDTFTGMGLQVQVQEIEPGRANVLGIRAGTGGGKTLMLTRHLDTSYSGREPW